MILNWNLLYYICNCTILNCRQFYYLNFAEKNDSMLTLLSRPDLYPMYWGAVPFISHPSRKYEISCNAVKNQESFIVFMIPSLQETVGEHLPCEAALVRTLLCKWSSHNELHSNYKFCMLVSTGLCWPSLIVLYNQIISYIADCWYHEIHVWYHKVQVMLSIGVFDEQLKVGLN